MKPNNENVHEILERYLPSAANSEMESDGDRVWRRLRTRVEEGPAGRISIARPRVSFGRRRTLAVLGVAAVLLLAFVATIPFQRQTDEIATVERAYGLLYRASDVLSGGAKIGHDDSLRSEGTTTLALIDGSRVEVRAKSQLSLERAGDGLRIHLRQGGIIVNAAKQSAGRHLYVRTKDVTVSVVGTVFLVNAEEEGSRVAVIEGEVRVKQGDVEKSLRPGQQVLTRQVMQWQPVSDGISWSGSRETHLALLQQSTSTVADAEPREAFEVISIRPTVLQTGTGGRGQGGGGNPRNPRMPDQPCSYAYEPHIDPRRFDAVNATVVQLVAWAYQLQCVAFSPDRGPDFLFGGPPWTRNDGYDVLAIRPEGPADYTTVTRVANRPDTLPGPKLQRMLQTMLADRFKLEMHREKRETPVYLLSPLPGGPKFTAAMGPPTLTDKDGNPIDKPAAVNGVPQPNGRVPNPNTPRPEFSIWREEDTIGRDGWQRDIDIKGATEIHLRHKTMADFVGALSFIVGRPVLDRTKLTGDYNFFFQFRAVECATCPFTAQTGAASRERTGDAGPTDSLFDLLKKVGLELKVERESLDVLVIDRVERPTEN